MSKLLFVSNSGESLPLVYRLRQEGTDADIYIHSPKCSKCYAGIINKVTLTGLRKNEKNTRTHTRFIIHSFLCSGLGNERLENSGSGDCAYFTLG